MKLGKRKLPNWLKALQEYVEETEAPRDFWLWGGIFTLCSALQRRVWLPYGLEPIFPNIYILLVAPPGKCRKAGPPSLAKKMLRKVNIPVSIDSFSKRDFTKELAELGKTEHFTINGETRPQTPIALISKEMSDLLAVDPKGMIEVLTTLYDPHEEWEYGTSGQGHDKLYGPCISCFIATTPVWFAANLPHEAIGGGFTSRFAIVTGYDKYKRVPIPPIPDEGLYNKLLSDLSTVAMLTGEFQWTLDSKKFFEEWYDTLDDKVNETKDERLHSFIERMHVIALKAAMGIHVSYSNDLVMELSDVEAATRLLETVLKTAGDALGGHGRSITSVDIELIMRQVRHRRNVTFSELLSINYRNTNKPELLTVMDTIIAMGMVEERVSAEGVKSYRWKGGEKNGRT